jgi:hypothetical protein
MMGTIHPITMRQILRHLDAALAETRRDTPEGVLESTLTWRISQVRDALLDAALGAVDVAAPAESNVAEPIRVAA